MLGIIGLMSGTSADGIDASFIRSDGKQLEATGQQLSFDYPVRVREAVYAARKNAAAYLANPHRREGLIRGITDAHIDAVAALRQKAGHPKIDFIGFHGQTVYHNPAAGRTIQLGDGQYLASQTKTPVIYDFRAADMAAGGQGAPLAPIYHQIMLLQSGLPLPALFINIGGVANASFIDDSYLEGYDIGPGNGLIDDLCQIFYQKPFDENGAIAGSGQIYQPFIDRVLADPFFQLVGPRSLDRAAFHPYLKLPDFASLPAADQIATATALSAQAICHSLTHLPGQPKNVLIAGGGVHNHTRMKQIENGLPEGSTLIEASAIGCDADFAEAELIALLAARWHAKLPSSFPATTGVSAPQICGICALPAIS